MAPEITQDEKYKSSRRLPRRGKALESGNTNPTFETLTKLAEVLDMELNLEIKLPKFL